jgi:DNA-binding transcriptional MerR regulator
MGKKRTGGHHALSPASLTVTSPVLETPLLLTVGDIAKQLSPIAPDTDATIQRIRHWTRERLMTPAGQHHAGTGKHREYVQGDVFDAAILHAFVAAGLQIASERSLIDQGLTAARSALQKWGKHRGPLFLRISRSADNPELSKIEVSGNAEEPTDDITITIDLARLCNRLIGGK